VSATDEAVFTPPAVVLEGMLNGLGGISPATSFSAHRWAPTDLELPCAVIEIPRLERSSADGEERVSLGANGWLITYPVTLYFELTTISDAQLLAVAYLTAFVQAVDDDRGLSGTCLDASVVAAEPVIVRDEARAMFAYECQVQILKEVAY
jgi:hypothetical protein